MGGDVGNFLSSTVGQVGFGVGAGDMFKNLTGGNEPAKADRAVIDYSQFNPNAQEQSLTDMLMARANGTAPSAAEQQMQNGIGQAQRAASAQAASARGVNPALAARLAQQSQANLASQGIGQTTALRSQEQAAATGTAANLISDQRGSRVAGQQLNVQNVTGANTIDSNNANAAANRQGNMISGLGQAGMMMAMSDENEKKGVVDGGKSVQSFLDAISAKQYQYKDQANGSGDQVSPMAQDLEKTSMGNQMVMDTPEGKMVDYGKGFGAILASQAHLNERLNKMEGKGYARGGMVDGAAGVNEAVAGTRNMVGSDLNKVDLSNVPSAAKEEPKKTKVSPDNIAGSDGGGSEAKFKESLAMKAFAFGQGGKVPGQAQVAGDSATNDTVHAKLSPGELVIPRSVVQKGPDAIKSFAAALLEEDKTA